MDEKNKLKNTAFSVPPIFLKGIDKLVELGKIKNPSEGIRDAVVIHVEKEKKVLEMMQKGSKIKSTSDLHT